MNRLSDSKRAAILQLLVEGSSMRSATRLVGVSINTVSKLLVDAGQACAAFHDEHVRGVPARRVQCDEIWAYCYVKRKNIDHALAAPSGAGDLWTWTAIDPDSKLIVSWFVGDRDTDAAVEFMDDLSRRLANRVQLTTDAHRPYLEAVEAAFGADVDYARTVKVRQAESAVAVKETVVGHPDMSDVGTSYVERHNLTMRMSMRRFTRLTNGFSKKVDNHCHALALYFVFYNWCRVHKTLGMTPAMAAGLASKPRSMEWLVSLLPN